MLRIIQRNWRYRARQFVDGVVLTVCAVCLVLMLATTHYALLQGLLSYIGSLGL